MQHVLHSVQQSLGGIKARDENFLSSLTLWGSLQPPKLWLPHFLGFSFEKITV